MPKRWQNYNRGGKSSKRRKGKTKTSSGWDKYFQEFQKTLEPKGIYMRDVGGDGNCLFRALSDQIEGNEVNHRYYRDLALEHIRDNIDTFKLFLLEDETIDEYLKDMEEDGTWGGHFELVALSEALKCNFCLHIKGQEPVIVHGSQTNIRSNCRTYHLGYHVENHYSSIRKLGDNKATPAAEIELSNVMTLREDSVYSDEEDELAYLSLKAQNRSGVSKCFSRFRLKNKAEIKASETSSQSRCTTHKPSFENCFELFKT